MKKYYLLLLILPLLFSCSSTSKIEVKNYEIYPYIDENGEFIKPLNTSVTLTSYKKYNASSYIDLCSKVEKTIWDVHYLVDAYKTYQDINGIATVNSYYGKGPLKVDSALIELLDISFTVSELTNGLFNPTLGCLIDTWKPYFDEGKIYSSIPSESEISSAKEKCIPYNLLREYILLDKENSTITFNKYNDFEEIKINLGAISKGFALEKVGDILTTDSFILSSGSSSLKCIGKCPYQERDYYIVSLIAPSLRIPDDQGEYPSYQTLINIKINEGENLSTSGDYEKFIINNGQVYSHILDPNSGYSSSLFSEISLVSSLPADILDGLSTALMNTKSKEEASKMIDVFQNEYNEEISYAFIIRNSSKYELYLSESYNQRILQKNNSIIHSMEVI